MSKEFKTEENGKTILNIIPDDISEISGDGFGPMLVGFPNTKISVFRQQLSDPNEQQIERRMIATIHVPTLALLGLGQNVGNILKANSDQIHAMCAQIDEILNQAPQPKEAEPVKPAGKKRTTK